MSLSSFTFDGKNSDDFGIIIEKKKRIFLGEKRNTGIVIPKRNGKFYPNSKRYYNEFIIEVRCFYVGSGSFDTRLNERELSFWLSKKGKLIFADEPDKYYIAEIYDEINFDSLGIADRFTLSFLCEPFAYCEKTDIPIRAGRNKVDYKGTYEAPTLLVLKNTGSKEINKIIVTTVSRKG